MNRNANNQLLDRFIPNNEAHQRLYTVILRYQAAITYQLKNTVPQIFGSNPLRDQYSATVFMRYETPQSLRRLYPDENKENESPRWR
uniref:Catalase n=1 Tax=Ascaris lumbricoides TaxID=6252 RepID=A0A0M3HVV4_ASCLU